MIEILDPGQPWEIPLPHTWEDHERILEARKDGRRVERWASINGQWLDRHGDPMGYGWIVMVCMNRGWRLFSMPKGVQLRGGADTGQLDPERGEEQ